MTSAIILNMDDVPLADDAPVVYDDMMRLTPAATPIPGQEMEPPYRCPVSTPSNFVHPFAKGQRTKPLPVNLEINLSPRSNAGSKRSVGGKPPRTVRDTNRSQSQRSTGRGGPGGAGSGGGGVGKFGPVGGRRGGIGLGGLGANGTGLLNPGLVTNSLKSSQSTLNARSLDYYYVDKAEEKREAAEVNTFWLKALCSQPVTEILDKYRRRSELRRTRYIWSKTYTTPGEKSLLHAWERNVPQNTLRYPTVSGFTRGGLVSGVGGGIGGGSGGAGETQSLMPPQSSKGPGGRAAGGGGGGGGSMHGSALRPYHSEPFNGDAGTRGYSSDDDENDDFDDDTEGEVTRAGASMSSGDVSVSTPRYPQRHQSPNHRHQQQDSVGSSTKKGDLEHGSGDVQGSLCGETTSSMQYPDSHSAYDISDHFQVTLPSLKDPRSAKERTSNTKPRSTGGSLGQPERYHDLRDLRPEVLPAEVKKVSREARANRNSVGSKSATQAARSRKMDTVLPAIGRS